MKKITFLIFALFAFATTQAQYQIDFDSFTVGDVDIQSSHLILWPASTATSPQVVTAQANSTPNSMKVGSNTTDDILFQLGDKTSGTWIVKWMMYLPADATGYWNIQENQTASPDVYNGEFFVGNTDSGGADGVVTYNSTSSTAAYTEDKWFAVVIVVDLDNSKISITVDGNSLLTNVTYEDTDGNIVSQLGAIDFFSIDSKADFYIDDFEFYESCGVPKGLIAKNVTDVEADISWTGPLYNETNGYKWTLMVANDNPTTDTPVQSGTTATGITKVKLTKLAPFTTYDFYVSTNCGVNGESNLSNKLGFKTKLRCDLKGGVKKYPFTENFEKDSPTLGCWMQVNVKGFAGWFFAEGSSGGTIVKAHEGEKNLQFVSTLGKDAPIAKFISPVLDITSLKEPELSFYYAQELFLGDQNELKVYYRKNKNAPWVKLMHDTTNVDAWTRKALTLPSPTATYQIAFEGINNFGYANVIDDVRVGEHQIICKEPTNLIVIPTDTSADVSWDVSSSETNGDGNGYKWAVMKMSEIPGTDTPVAQGTTASGVTKAQATGLTPDTNYELYVHTLCVQSVTSPWSGPVSFKTKLLSTLSPIFKDFKYYPNPFQNELVLTSHQIIEQVNFYNILGEKVVSKKSNQLNLKLETSQLPVGVYFMEVYIEGKSEVFKLIKE